MRGHIGTGALALLLTSPLCQGEIARFISPFDGMKSARLTVVIGGPLDIEGGGALRLFAGKRERADRFTHALVDAVTAKLRSCGIAVEERVNDEISVRVFGRLEGEAECDSGYIYMVELTVFNSTLEEDDDDAGFSALRPVIGLADDDALEEVLISTSLAILTAELKNCSNSPYSKTD